jgi:hypothetical protein
MSETTTTTTECPGFDFYDVATPTGKVWHIAKVWEHTYRPDVGCNYGNNSGRRVVVYKRTPDFEARTYCQNCEAYYRKATA